jgi:ABC-2 type transport system permease protein
MRHIWIIIKHEIRTTLRKRSFWFMTFVFPALILALNVGVTLIAENAGADSDAVAEALAGGGVSTTLGYVDQGGLIQQLPPDIPAGLVQAYPDEAAAQAALQAGSIDNYYIIPPDFVDTGQIILVQREFRPFQNTGEQLVRLLIAYNLTGDLTLATALINPLPSVSYTDIAPQPEAATEPDSPLAFFVPYVTLFIFFFLITMSSGFMLQSVAREKENRVAEVLLVSLEPRELMLGKVLALSFIALLQMVVWMSGGLLVLSQRTALLDTVSGYTFPPGFFIWVIPYFFLGYLLYASLMGAVGALAPSAREGGQVTFFILLPMMIPLWMLNVLIGAPHGTVSVAFSLFPLTAPLAMITRLVIGGVPWWQPLAGLLGLALTTYLVVLLSARLFRADTLLSSAPLRWRSFLSQLRGALSRA